MSELEITEQNFAEHFFDVRQNKPQRGQIMACYSAMAELVEGNEKRQLVELLQRTDKAVPASQVMRKLLCASEADSVRVLKQMAEDLISGLTVEQVLAKPYKYKFEMFFYTKLENVPKDDPHWSVISLLNVDTVFDSLGNSIRIEAKERAPINESTSDVSDDIGDQQSSSTEDGIIQRSEAGTEA
jgi:hypothetical protein